MQVMNFSEANCKHCYKCVRKCEVKAIKIENDQAHIMEDKCIACGQCFAICPQNARNIMSDLDFVKSSILSGRNINISIAPSFRGFFKESSRFISAIEKLGFNQIEETAVGADIVSKAYEKFLSLQNGGAFITTCCPSVVFLIQKYYPSLVDCLIPIISPMIAHGKLLKKERPNDVTVFLGPCVSKKCEAISRENSGIIDAVLTFDEIALWISEEGIDYLELPPSDPHKYGSVKGKQYPIVGGILEGIRGEILNKGFISMRIDGVDECKEVFQEIINGNLENSCIEVSACKKSCIGGPGGHHISSSIFSRLQNVKEYLLTAKTQEPPVDSLISDSELKKNISKNPLKEIEIDERKIKKILIKMGKFSKVDELNCASCGYNTCRENAIAVLNGMSSIDMCMPFIKSRAERISNEIFENSPNALLIVNDDFEIIESNMSFSRFFGVTPSESKGQKIDSFIAQDDLLSVFENKKNMLWKKIHLPKYNLHMKESVIHLDNQNALLIILSDISDEEKRRSELFELKENTLNITQGVIEKQMRVAQEIASLLGETTAETKVALTKLKHVLEKEGAEF
ncbi:[Fe-Fe] hydrogenase large subunit C-terminal domain-containing protein [uncultured Ilyobacter sp.]|uniref:[Fe-Fe] hydrogenase large subunit C-terminal domain-containing protein n=1 Tax=uncultured Ilyobacter sp. TaxID=544433 RepID=UPI0029C7A3CF|nr:[Fe-Fe] hydrogenase large subunit C-terminal domain-containing protein [uncultured Ilyobacter sp.]